MDCLSASQRCGRTPKATPMLPTSARHIHQARVIARNASSPPPPAHHRAASAHSYPHRSVDTRNAGRPGSCVDRYRFDSPVLVVSSPCSHRTQRGSQMCRRREIRCPCQSVLPGSPHDSSWIGRVQERLGGSSRGQDEVRRRLRRAEHCLRRTDGGPAVASNCDGGRYPHRHSGQRKACGRYRSACLHQAAEQFGLLNTCASSSRSSKLRRRSRSVHRGDRRDELVQAGMGNWRQDP